MAEEVRPIDDGPDPEASTESPPDSTILGEAPGFEDIPPGIEGDEWTPTVDRDRVAEFLERFGDLANWLLPTPDAFPGAWQFTPDEINFLAPALTRVANARAPAVADMVTQRSDEVAVAVGLGRYVGRNIKTLRAAAAVGDFADFDEQPEPEHPPVHPFGPQITGESAEDDPEPDPEPEHGGPGEVPDEHQRPYFEQ